MAKGKNTTNYVKEVLAGRFKKHHLEKVMPIQDAIKIRQEVVRQATKTNIPTIANFTSNIEKASYRNCENIIGATQIPMGIAGPLKIKGDHAQGNFYLPLTTTEGVLVASVDRGCRAVTSSGGANTLITPRGITRAPVFKTKSIKDSKKFIGWIEKNLERIKKQVSATDHFIILRDIKPWMVDKLVFLRFIFDTSDAMGMNMAVVACDNVIRNFISPKTGIRCLSISGNMCTDKKPSALNFIEGRGISVWAETIISKKDTKKILKTTPAEVVEVNISKNLIGSAMAGSYGFNAHYANIVAALFLSTGQDPGHIVEGSNGITTANVTDQGDLYFSIYLPSLIIGAVGGGTHLNTQREALSILQVNSVRTNPGRASKKLAEIIGGAVLAGELSLVSALASGDLAHAHETYGRGKKK